MTNSTPLESDSSAPKPEGSPRWSWESFPKRTERILNEILEELLVSCF